MSKNLTTERGDETTEVARIIIGDGDSLARGAVRAAFDRAAGFVVIAEARDGVEAAELAGHYHPELVLLEASLPRLDGLSTLERILANAPRTQVVMLSAAEGGELGLAALRAGASGFLSKDIGADAVVDAVRSVLAGEIVTSLEMNRRLVEHLRWMPEFGVGMRPTRSTLTSREWEVLDLLTVGRSTAEMAGALYLTSDTVQSHVKNLMRKLDVHTRAEAVECGHDLRGHNDDRLLMAA